MVGARTPRVISVTPPLAAFIASIAVFSCQPYNRRNINFQFYGFVPPISNTTNATARREIIFEHQRGFYDLLAEILKVSFDAKFCARN